MVNVISADNLRVVSDLNQDEFKKGFENFDDILQSVAYKGRYETTFGINPEWARRYSERIYEELEMLGFTKVKLYEGSIYLSWKKEKPEKDKMTKVDDNVEVTFRNLKYAEPNKAIHGVLDVLKETARSVPGENGGYDVIMNPEKVWGRIAHDVLHKTLERGGIYKVTEFSDIRIVISWRYKG